MNRYKHFLSEALEWFVCRLTKWKRMKYSAAPVFSALLQKLLVHGNLSINDAHTIAGECTSSAHNSGTQTIKDL